MRKVTSFLSPFPPQGLASYQWWISDMHAITRQFNRGCTSGPINETEMVEEKKRQEDESHQQCSTPGK
ncbi:hypothetical protein R3I93_001640 [Phoxinus phoxinus]|uniref:Uncharacterized protein n=1 Tax=Phoxinus phoxinus TaxID=58324 RepID=A0AAN9HGD1_9TELE